MTSSGNLCQISISVSNIGEKFPGDPIITISVRSVNNFATSQSTADYPHNKSTVSFNEF